MKPSNVIFWLLIFFGGVDAVFYFTDAQTETIVGISIMAFILFVVWIALSIKENMAVNKT